MRKNRHIHIVMYVQSSLSYFQRFTFYAVHCTSHSGVSSRGVRRWSLYYNSSFMSTLHSRRVVNPSRIGAFDVSLGSGVLCVVVVRRTLSCTRVRRLTQPSTKRMSCDSFHRTDGSAHESVDLLFERHVAGDAFVCSIATFADASHACSAPHS